MMTCRKIHLYTVVTDGKWRSKPFSVPSCTCLFFIKHRSQPPVNMRRKCALALVRWIQIANLNHLSKPTYILQIALKNCLYEERLSSFLFKWRKMNAWPPIQYTMLHMNQDTFKVNLRLNLKSSTSI